MYKLSDKRVLTSLVEICLSGSHPFSVKDNVLTIKMKLLYNMQSTIKLKKN